MAIGDTEQLADECLSIAEGSVVKLCNFSGTQIGAIIYSEAEGVPEYLSLNGKYLATVTSTGCVKVVDVYNPQKTVMSGSVGHLWR